MQILKCCYIYQVTSVQRILKAIHLKQILINTADSFGGNKLLGKQRTHTEAVKQKHGMCKRKCMIKQQAKGTNKETINYLIQWNHHGPQEAIASQNYQAVKENEA